MSLIKAAENGDDETIKKLVKSGTDINSTNEIGCTALFYACNSGQLSSVVLLIELGANINARNIHKQTPLMWAVLSKNEKIVQYLIAHGADVDAKAEGGLSAYGLSLSNSNSTISNMIRSNSDDESLSSKSSGRKFSDGSTSPSSLSSLARMSIEEERDDLSPIVATVNTASFNKNRRSSSTPDLKQLALTGLIRSTSTNQLPRISSLDDLKDKAIKPEDPPTIRFLHNLSELGDAVELHFASISSLEVSFVPLTSQTKETKSTYQTLLKRRILAEFLVKRGGVRTNWKCRYFLLTGDHLHYFEPQIKSSSKGDQGTLLEPSPSATPLGSISLHSIVGNVHKSDLGVVFCFQIPTSSRTYHIKAPSARSIERWLNVLNGNAKRIQMASTRFPDMVFRLVTVWKDGTERAILRNGREFQTIDLIMTEHFSNLNVISLPIAQIEEHGPNSKEILVILVDYLKNLLKYSDPQVIEQVSKFLTDQGTEFFAAESRREVTGVDNGQYDLKYYHPVSAMSLSPILKEKSKMANWLVSTDFNSDEKTSSLHFYDYEGFPILSNSKHKPSIIQGEVLAIHHCLENSFFSTTAFVESRKPKETNSGNNVKYVGTFPTTLWDSNLTIVTCIATHEITVDSEPIWFANDSIDTITVRRKGESHNLIAKVVSPKMISIMDTFDKSIVKSLFCDLKGSDKVNVIKFNKREINTIAVGTDQGIQIWDYLKGEVLVNLKYPCISLTFSPDGKKIAAVGLLRSKIKYWEVRTGRRIKKLAAGFSTAKDDLSLQYHPKVSWNQKSNQILVVSSFGDVVLWNYDFEQTDETQTVMNVEHNYLSEVEISTANDKLPQGVNRDSEIANKKAKALEPAIYAECKGCIIVLSSKTDFARYSCDGVLVVTYSRSQQKIRVYLSRNGELVSTFNLEYSPVPSQFCSLEFSLDGKQLTFADGNHIITRTIPLDKNGDIIMDDSKEPDEEEQFISIGWAPRHIENDPMIPYYEHQLIIAITENNNDRVKKIIKISNLNVDFHSAMDGWTPLTLACKLGFYKIVRTLIKAGAEITFSRRDDNMRPIHAASSSGDLKTVLVLVENGATPNTYWNPNYHEIVDAKHTPTHIAPIHIAAVNGFVEIIDALLSCGADIESMDSNNRTPIIYAASKRENIAAVQLLVRRGADCTARGRTGTSALHEAAKNDSQKMVMLLLKEGVEAENERNSRGETAVDINPQLFSMRKYDQYLRSDTKVYLKYQMKMNKSKEFKS